MPDKKKAAKKPANGGKKFSAAERAAMRERVKEMKGEGEGEAAVLAKLAAMPEPDRSIGKRIHQIVMAAAPSLEPRLWYGMPAYSRDGKTLCHFQDARKFKTRYATFGFSDKAALDDGDLWPVAFAVQKLTPATEAKISALVKQAAG